MECNSHILDLAVDFMILNNCLPDWDDWEYYFYLIQAMIPLGIKEYIIILITLLSNFTIAKNSWMDLPVKVADLETIKSDLITILEQANLPVNLVSMTLNLNINSSKKLNLKKYRC